MGISQRLFKAAKTALYSGKANAGALPNIGIIPMRRFHVTATSLVINIILGERRENCSNQATILCLAHPEKAPPLADRTDISGRNACHRNRPFNLQPWEVNAPFVTELPKNSGIFSTVL